MVVTIVPLCHSPRTCGLGESSVTITGVAGIGPPRRRGLRLPFAAVGPDGIARGIETLGKLMKETRTDRPSELSDDRSVEVMPIV